MSEVSAKVQKVETLLASLETAAKSRGDAASYEGLKSVHKLLEEIADDNNIARSGGAK